MTRNVTMTTGVLCGMLAASIAFAQETKQQDDLPQPRESRQNLQETQQRQRTGQTRQGNRQAEMPTFLQQLDLTSEQEQGIRQALQQHDQKLRQTWRQFNTTHARAIQLEAAWVAAVRDTLSEEDQRKFDQQRMQQTEMSRYGQSDDARRNEADRDDANRSGQNRERNQDRNSDQNRDANQSSQNREGNQNRDQDRTGNRADQPESWRPCRTSAGIAVRFADDPERRESERAGWPSDRCRLRRDRGSVARALRAGGEAERAAEAAVR